MLSEVHQTFPHGSQTCDLEINNEQPPHQQLTEKREQKQNYLYQHGYEHPKSSRKSKSETNKTGHFIFSKRY